VRGAAGAREEEPRRCAVLPVPEKRSRDGARPALPARRGLRRLPQREPHGVVQLRAPLQRRAHRASSGLDEQRLGVVDGVVGVVDAHQRRHLVKPQVSASGLSWWLPSSATQNP
jgi:hypothetical protein